MTALGIDGGQSGLRLRQVGTDEVVEAATVSQADDDLASAYAASLRAVLPAQAVGLVRAVAGLSAIPDDDAGRRRLAEVLRSVTWVSTLTTGMLAAVALVTEACSASGSVGMRTRPSGFCARTWSTIGIWNVRPGPLTLVSPSRVTTQFSL